MANRTRTASPRRSVATAPRAEAVRVLRSPPGADPVTRLRAICLALPEAVEKIAWGEPTWRAGSGKMFAQMDTHHHGADHVAVWLPLPLGMQEALVEADPVRFFVPPYVGHRGWLGVRIDRRPDWGVVAGLVEEAYRLVASPRLRTLLTAPQVRLDAPPRRRR